MTTTGFWHICMINNYLEVITEQLSLLEEGGLYAEAKEINVGLVGLAPEVQKVKNLFVNHPKIKIAYHSNDINEYEFPTLKLLHQHCKKGLSDFVFYFHTKGVFNKKGKHWRDYMNYYNLTLWRYCLANLIVEFDIVGVKWIENNKAHPQHFSGNFFHASSKYISTLPDIDLISKMPRNGFPLRHNAEFWHGMGNPNWHSLRQLMIDHNTPNLPYK